MKNIKISISQNVFNKIKKTEVSIILNIFTIILGISLIRIVFIIQFEYEYTRAATFFFVFPINFLFISMVIEIINVTNVPDFRKLRLHYLMIINSFFLMIFASLYWPEALTSTIIELKNHYEYLAIGAFLSSLISIISSILYKLDISED
ncbi:MAG: hypothetical protein KGD63_02130 [Candidatus Lokiarchaeota archaeon]|nr:hypothetical protein [Candidatus Lokiarchaeota archaeon]